MGRLMMDSGAGATTASGEEWCATCRRPLAGRGAFQIGGRARCWRCALRHPPLVRRSARVALVVGTLLVLINQGTVLAAGAFPPELTWKIPLTYLVPFCVATWGALSNSQRA
jgi:hypothetical protein